MKQKAKETTHFSGKYSGYELIDGVYHIAPMYTDQFAKLSDRREGVNQLLKSVVRHVEEINREIALEQRGLWERLYDDLGFDKRKHYSYERSGTIQLIEEKKQEVI